jgi:hypothetical protein
MNEIFVYRNGKLQVLGLDPLGNYTEVDEGNGYGTTIEFNNSNVLDDSIAVVFGLTFAGDIAIFSDMERLSGAILAISQDLALATGNPVDDYLTANPSEVERSTYGAKVLQNESDIATKLPIKYQTKVYTGPSITDGIKLQFNNLEIGKVYRISGWADIDSNRGPAVVVSFNNGVTQVTYIRLDSPAVNFGDGDVSLASSAVEIFTATSTTFTVEAIGFAAALTPGTSILILASATIEELQNHIVTSQWT